MKTIIQISMDVEIAQQLQIIAKKRYISFSQLGREALEEYVERHNSKQK